MVRRETDPGPVRDLGCEVVPGDVLDEEAYAAAAWGCGRIFHVAGFVSFLAEDRGWLERVNVDGVRHAVEAAKAAEVETLVVTSSVAAVGGGEDPAPVDETYPWPGDEAPGYASTKRRGELLARAAASEGIHAVCVNPGIVLGPGDPRPSAGGEYVLRAARGRIPFAPRMVQGFVDARDVAEGHLLAAERGRAGERYILNAASLPMPDFVALCREAAGKRGRPIPVPAWVLPPLAAVAEAWGSLTGRPIALTRERARMARRHAAFSSAKAERELGWKARPLAETVRDAVAWFRERGML